MIFQYQINIPENILTLKENHGFQNSKQLAKEVMSLCGMDILEQATMQVIKEIDSMEKPQPTSKPSYGDSMGH